VTRTACWVTAAAAVGICAAASCSKAEETGELQSTTSPTTTTATGITTSTSTSTSTTTDCGSLVWATSSGCKECSEASCCAELADCESVTECVAAVECTKSCAVADVPCHLACLSDSLTSWFALQDCLLAHCEAECWPSADATCAPAGPNDGSCVTLGGAIDCNPVTNEPCDPGYTCDTDDDGFRCWPGPSDDHALCETCGVQDSCAAGLRCFGVCGKFCCGDAECAPGTCQKDFGFPSNVGVCTGGN